MSTDIQKFNAYLDTILPPAQNPNPSSGRWVWKKEIVTYEINPKQHRTEFNDALRCICRDLNFFYNRLNIAEKGTSIYPKIAQKLEDLKTQVGIQVKEIKDFGNQNPWESYFGFYENFFTKIDPISKELIANIFHLKVKLNPILNQYIIDPTTKRANLLPIPESAFSYIAQFLDVNALVTLTKTSKQGSHSTKDAWLLKAQEFGYKGNHQNQAKEYLNALGEAVLKMIELYGLGKSDKQIGGFIYWSQPKWSQSKKREITLLELTLKDLTWEHFIYCCNEAYCKETISKKYAKILCQCWLHLIENKTISIPCISNTEEAKTIFGGTVISGCLDALRLHFIMTTNNPSHTPPFFIDMEIFIKRHKIGLLLSKELSGRISSKGEPAQSDKVDDLKPKPNCHMRATALQAAVRFQHESVVKLLIQYGASIKHVNQIYNDGHEEDRIYDTPLQLALQKGNVRLVSLLLDAAD